MTKIATPPQFNAAQATRFLRHVVDPTACSELRIPRADISRSGIIYPFTKFGRTVGGWFNRVDSFVANLTKIQNVSAYITVNPVKSEMLSLINNRAIITKSLTKKENIKSIRWVYVDIDSVRLKGSSATDEEVSGCVSVRDSILSDHKSIAQNSLWGKSGNGCWILVRLEDCPPTVESEIKVKSLLHFLADRYGSIGKGNFHIDTQTYDCVRIMCLPGTLKCKGENMPDRKWRLATLDGEFGAEIS